jgi:hypothetical protein
MTPQLARGIGPLLAQLLESATRVRAGDGLGERILAVATTADAYGTTCQSDRRRQRQPPAQIAQCSQIAEPFR